MRTKGAKNIKRNKMQANDKLQTKDQKHVAKEEKQTPKSTSPNDKTNGMTFQEYDDFCDRAEEIELFNLEPYWPHPDDIELKASKFPPVHLALFYTWLLMMNGDPKTPEEEESKKLMKQFAYKHLELKD